MSIFETTVRHFCDVEIKPKFNHTHIAPWAWESIINSWIVDDFIITKLDLFEGCIGVVSTEDLGHYIQKTFPTTAHIDSTVFYYKSVKCLFVTLASARSSNRLVLRNLGIHDVLLKIYTKHTHCNDQDESRTAHHNNIINVCRLAKKEPSGPG